MAGNEASSMDGIAIIGMSGRFPGAGGVDALWDNLIAGKDCISHFAPGEVEARDRASLRGDPTYVRARGVLEGVDLWDAGFFGVTPREAELIDPQHRLFLECCWEALEDAGHDPERYPGAIGVYAGQSLPTYLLANLARDRAFLDQITGEYQVGSYPVVLGNDKDYLATRVCYKLNLRGAGMTIQCACSTSLVAVCQAVQALSACAVDMVLAGGVSITFPQQRGYQFQEGGMVSPDGRCRPFDASAQGTVFASGVGVVLLKRLDDALRDGDHVYAVIKGSAINNDGSLKVGYMAPSPERQAEVIALAQAVAGVSASSISYVEAHGTGTPLGDPIEVDGLTRAFRATSTGENFCALGSIKGNLGHLEVAAGVTGLIKTALALHHRALPKSLHFERPNPQLRLPGSPFFINSETREWPGPSPRRAGVSAFGVGGTNAHVVLEEAPLPPAAAAAWPEQLLVVSARSEAALGAACQRLATHLTAQNPDGSALADAAYTLQVGRRHFAHRRALVVTGAADAAALEVPAAAAGASGGRAQPANTEDAPPRTLFLFPGQGAQHVGMAAGLYKLDAAFRADLDACCAALEPQLGFELRRLLFEADPRDATAQARLAQTVVTQPAIFAVEWALARLWLRLGVAPDLMLGHSVGEYVAACTAGVFTMPDAARLVSSRAALIQALPPGAMLSVRLSEENLRARLSADLDVAAVNGPSLCVASGPAESIAALESRLAAEGVACRRLRTSHAFHSSMMDPCLAAFEARVREVPLSAPQRPFISSVTGRPIETAQATDPAYWARHVREPVRFAEGVLALAPADALVIEVGPGRALSQLVRQSGGKPPRAVVASLPDPSDAEASESRELLSAIGRAFTAGARIDFAALHAPGARRRVRLPGYPFERRSHWIAPPAIASPPEVAPVEIAPVANPPQEELELILKQQMDIMQRQIALLQEFA